MYRLFIGCFGTRAHGRQVMSMLYHCDFLIHDVILFHSIFSNFWKLISRKKIIGGQEKESFKCVRVG